MSSSGEWVQYYQQTLDGNVSLPVAFSDATTVNATSNATSERIVDNPSSSSTTVSVDHQLSSRGSVSKPIRRRSRASKRTPTTLLNADANNFRALVQKFTGCPSTTFSFGSTKGPVNLSFERGNGELNHLYGDDTVMASFGNNHQYYQQSTQHKQEQAWQQHHQQSYQQQQQQLEKSLASFNSGSSETIFETVCNDPPRGTIEIPYGFDMDDIALDELTRDTFSSEDRYDGYYS